jgi:hypothetical protein
MIVNPYKNEVILEHDPTEFFMHDQKENQMSTLEPPQLQPRKRPTLLRGMLNLWMLFNAISAYIYFRSLSGVWIAITPLGHPKWTLLPIALLCLVNFVCVFAIWKWKRWGMYGLAASAIVMFIITLISLDILNAFISISGVIIIGLLVRQVWKQMD